MDYKSFDEVDRLTIPEYELLMEGAALKWVDLDYRNHLQAYLNFSVKAMKKSGKNKQKPVFSKFNAFYDYEEAQKKVKKKENKKERFSGIGKFFSGKGKGE